jgi:hypothetical protein
MSKPSQIRAKFPPASDRTKATVEKFLQAGLESFETALGVLESVPKSDRPDWVIKNIAYYRNCLSAVNWLKSINRTRRGK